MAHRVTLIPGDGIGPELAEATRRVLDATGVAFEWEVVEAGEATIATKGTPLPDEVLESIRRNKVALKGPITTPVGSGFRSVNVGLRQALNLYANLRPARSMVGVQSRYEDVDLVIVRENTEDLYAGIEHMVGRDAAESIKIITRAASERIARFAFEYAVANGRRKVTAVHKANIMKLSDGLFLESCRTVAEGYADRIEFEDRIVDNMCMQLVQKPDMYDVLVLPNLYGDIVSDLAAGLVGGLGVAPGANIGEDGAVFEPVHGSAPKYAGQNKANPTALILSGALMLRHLGYAAEGERVERAVREVIAEGRRTTYDLGGDAGTSEFGDAVIERLTAAAIGRVDAGRAGRLGGMTVQAAVLRALRKPRGTAAQGFAKTRRRDSWAVYPIVQGLVFTICAGYLTFSGVLWQPLGGPAYEVDGYLSPLFSPLIVFPNMPWWLSPGLLILWIPIGFRATCYYYRKAYYRFYFADPPGCAVGEPTIHRRFALENALPVHPPEPPPLPAVPRVHPADVPVARPPARVQHRPRRRTWPTRGRGSASSAVLFLVNVVLLTGYSLSCHSLRHLVGGRIDCFSCTRARRVRYTLWQRLTDLNRNHMWWAWTSLITVTAADVYVRLMALGVISDRAIHF